MQKIVDEITVCRVTRFYGGDPAAALESLVHQLAQHPDPVARYIGSIGLVCDLYLQNDHDGLCIAADCAMGFLWNNEVNNFHVRAVTDEAGRITGFIDPRDEFPDDSLMALIGAIARLPDVDQREMMLRAVLHSTLDDPSHNWVDDVSWFLERVLEKTPFVAQERH